MEIVEEYISMKSKPSYLCRWWLRSRKFINGCEETGHFECIEFYVPWWAWPLDLLHRVIFGTRKLKKRNKHGN